MVVLEACEAEAKEEIKDLKKFIRQRDLNMIDLQKDIVFRFGTFIKDKSIQVTLYARYSLIIHIILCSAYLF